MLSTVPATEKAIQEPALTLSDRLQAFAAEASADLERRFLVGEPDPDAVHMLAGNGLLGLTIPPQYGGLGRDYIALGAASERLARLDLSFQISLTVHLALTSMTILQWGSEQQRRQWLPALAAGSEIATFALTEPGAGSDVAAITTRARRDRAGFRLAGEKAWISGANESSLLLVFATVDPTLRHHGITAFLVPRTSSGVETPALRGKLGIRAGDTGSVVLSDVWVPDANVLGRVGEGFPIALAALGNGLFTVGFGALGIICECLHLTTDEVRRAALPSAGMPSQLMKHQIARMTAQEATARQLLDKAAALKNRGLPSQRDTSLAKWMTADGAVATAESALRIAYQLQAGSATAIARHLQNAKGAAIYGGTSQIHQIMQGAFASGDRWERPPRRPPLTADHLAGTVALEVDSKD
jgi:glutaryl-CoA dehydrogenase (non-decarboxylating)